MHIPLTTLIGRETEIATVSDLLRHPAVRLLTLTGTGGVGKTRLALALADRMRMQNAFADGVRFVSLADLRDARLVLPTIAQVLDLQISIDRSQADGTQKSVARSPAGKVQRSALRSLDEELQSQAEALQGALQEKRLLIVLDNFEQVMAAAPGLVDLLESCPHLKLLVTSRETLRVRGECEYLVQPLTLPDPDQSSDLESLARSSAVTLFLERAHEVQPTLALTARTAPLIIEICRRLDGLPLALELAAARLKVLSLQTLLERLAHRLQILSDGPRDLPERQRTLRSTIAWSYDLLNHEEQRLFRLCSVFASEWTLEAAEELYSRLGGERIRTLDVVTSLLDKHLLSRREQGNQPPRLLMHETIREYGLEELAAHHELEIVQRVHAEYYLGLAERQLQGVELTTWLKQLEYEHGNLRAALQWALNQPASEIVLRLESALRHFWEGYHRLEESLEEQESHAPEAISSTQITSLQHKKQNSRTSEIAISSPPAPLQHEEKEIGLHARLLYLLGIIAWVVGDVITARLYAEEGLTHVKQADDPVTLAYLTDLQGQLALDQGDDTRARMLLEEGLRLHRKAGDRLGCLNALFYLERVHAAQGEISHARASTEEHLVLSKEIGYRPGIIASLTFLGCLALEEGDRAQARMFFTESFPRLYEIYKDTPLTIVTNLQEIGITLAKLGRLTEAVQLWGAASTFFPFLPEERAFVARAMAAVRAKLAQSAKDAFTTAWTQGQTMTLEQALATAERIILSNRSRRQATKGSRLYEREKKVPAIETGKNHQRSLAPSEMRNLTKREVEVLRLVAQGLTDAQIAQILTISTRTVNAHLRSIYQKLGISSRNAATYLALEYHLI